MSNSGSIRNTLVDALELDLVGPAPGSIHATESIERSPSRWYLTGFLVPVNAPTEQRQAEEDAGEDLDAGAETASNAGGDGGDEEKQTAQRRFFPSSIGLSVLVPAEASSLEITVTWGDYTRTPEPGVAGRERIFWQRTPRAVTLSLRAEEPCRRALPDGNGLEVQLVQRDVPSAHGQSLVPEGTRAISIFLLNHRTPDEEAPERRDESAVFQAALRVECVSGFIARPDLHGHGSEDPDERISDLQYRDVHEYAVGHSVSPVATLAHAGCTRIDTTWLPTAYVHRVEAVGAKTLGLEPDTLWMDRLGEASTPTAVQQSLAPLIGSWQAFVGAASAVEGLSAKRADVVQGLCADARAACARFQAGLDALGDPVVFECFAIMNRVIAAAMRQRDKSFAPKGATEGRLPAWRPFQLAFILLNLPGMVDPTHADRRKIDLLYFPTGGGKTEAYLGIAAFTMFLRRRRRPGREGGGVSVLMRYTLRLLTLDQFERASSLLCAMELERRRPGAAWGDWPFEIGLWVGQGATPNRLGEKKNPAPGSARERVNQWRLKSGNERPVPVTRCPWCQTPLERKGSADPFEVVGDGPTARLLVRCVSTGNCPFSRAAASKQLGPGFLPMCLTDEEVYRRLPAFVIATVDKFANLPWVGPSGMLLGKATHVTDHGYEGPCDAHASGKKLTISPPDLVIQDELHLISGPLGTMVGLYETALDALMEHQGVRPKVIASTATVRRAEAQTRALFCREGTRIFPPPMPDRRALFFAQTVSDEAGARRYLGVAAQGRSHKVVLLRVYLCLLAAAKKHWDAHGGRVPGNPADPYMTLLGYFNSLKELGNARRIVEDEVVSRARAYGQRRRLTNDPGLFVDRVINYEVEELTSRESTGKVARTKAALALEHTEPPKDTDLKPIDVALATNMISVGLDITRLGLMVVCGQPKATAEYIQATSRVGRDHHRPGLVVTLLNIHRPRDRSHYERFGTYHEAFYRAVEATSVTPFSPRAMDRGLAAVAVALARHGMPELTPADAVAQMPAHRAALGFVSAVVGEREKLHATGEVQPHAAARTERLLDDWTRLVKNYKAHKDFQYGTELDSKSNHLLHSPLEVVEPGFEPFRARRSLRDVEPKANVWVRSLGWQTEEEES